MIQCVQYHHRWRLFAELRADWLALRGWVVDVTRANDRPGYWVTGTNWTPA